MIRSTLLIIALVFAQCSVALAASSYQPDSYDPVTGKYVGVPSGCVTVQPPVSTNTRSNPLFGVEVSFANLVTIDTTNANTTMIGPVGSPVIAGLAWDSATGTVYGVDTSTKNLVTVDLATGNTTIVGSTGLYMTHGLAIDPATGIMYTVDDLDRLYTLDKATGAATRIGSVGCTGIGALDFDPLTGVLYGAYASSNETGMLITIDTATGQGTFVAKTHRINGLCFDSNGVLFAVDNGLYGGVDSSLYTVNKNTGQWALVGSLAVDNVIGIIFEELGPIVDIKANGSDGPVVLNSGSNLSIDISLTPGNEVGNNADWWIFARSPFGWYSHDLTSGSWAPGFAVAHQASLHATGSISVFNGSSLPPGSYNFYFGVDTIMNGALDLGQLYIDVVTVAIQ
jgi:hypothetical protein